MEHLCYIGAGHRCANGLDVKTGQTFVPTPGELKAFPDLFITIDEAKRRGLYRGPAAEVSQLESVDAARERLQSEEQAIAERRGRAVSAPAAPTPAPTPQPAPEPVVADESGQDSDPEDNGSDADDDAGEPITLEQLDGMNIAGLKAFAKENEIDVSGKRSKADLVEAIWKAL